MKALYILFGLLLLATVGSAPSAPFPVGGCVKYGNGEQVNNPQVNLTDMNTGKVFTAEISNDCYLIFPDNISARDVVRFNVTDGVTYNITNYTVTEDDLNNSGIFDYALILDAASSATTGFSPDTPDSHDSPVHEVENAALTSGTANPTVLFMIYGWVFYENGSGCLGPVVNITNLNTGEHLEAKTHPDHYYYQLVLNTTDTANISAGYVLLINASKEDGTLVNSTEHVITSEEISNAAVMVDLNEGSVDLEVSGIVLPRGYYAGKNSTVAAVVENSGTAYTDGFEAAFFVNEKLNDTTYVPSMGPGGNRSVNFNWMPEVEGNYTIRVMADSGMNITETDESNNNLSLPEYVKFTDIDLAVTADISLNKTPLDGDIIRVDATLKNQGNDSADNFTVIFYDNNAAFHSEILSLDAGDSWTLSPDWNASYGKHDIRMVIDPDNKIYETDEMNNQRSSGVFFVDASRDFSITNVSFALDGVLCSPFELEWGRTVTINATIRAVNLANRNSSARVQFYRNAYGWDYGWYLYPRRNIDEIKILFGTGNSTGYATVEWHIDSPYSIGDLNITAVIDPEDEIHELDESNNETVVPVHVKASDFTVTNITANRTSLIFGETVELNATIENHGNAAGSTGVVFMVSSRDVPGSRDISMRNISVDAGGKEYVSIHWNTGETNLAGNCTVTVEVDPDKKVSEINESNNSLTMTRDPIFVNGTDLAVRDVIIPRPDHVEYEGELYQGDIVNVTARIENRGSIDAANFSVGFYDNDTSGNISLINVTNISSLSAGNYLYVNATWDLSDASEGKHRVQVRIDHCDKPENDLSNNYKEISIDVIAPWILDVSFSSLSVKEGENLTITAIVTNNGTRDRNASVKFYSDHTYLDNILFNEKTIRVPGNSSSTTEVVWNARPLFSGPMSNLTKTRVISVSVDNSNPASYSINIEPADLTIEGMAVNPDYNITITVKNNENRTIHPAFWFYDVNHTVCDIVPNKIYGNVFVEGVYSITHPDALDMSVYFYKINYEAFRNNAPFFHVTDKNGNLFCTETFSSTGTSSKTLNYWTKWGTGNTINITHMQISGPIKSAALLEYRQLSLNANETKNFTVQWNAKMGEDHTLWVQLGNKTQHKNISLNIDLAVTDVSANSTTSDGNQENITAVIANPGYGNASDFKVKFFNDSNLFYTENVTNLDSNTTITIPASWTADTWNEKEGIATLNHTIWVEIDRCGNSDMNENNNRKSRPVQVNPTRDFSVTNITFAQGGETGQTTINATIRNFGKAGSANVSIRVDKDVESCQIYSDNLWIDDTYYVNETWNASVAGNCAINVTADPDNRILEINESNNSLAIPVYIEAPDLIVRSLIIDPADLIEGNKTNITAFIANTGERDANNVTVAFYDRGNHIQSGNWILKKGKSEITLNQPDAAGIRVHFKELKLPGATSLNIYNENGNPVTIIGVTTSNMWTQWIPGSSVNIIMSSYSVSFAEIDKYEYHKIFNTTYVSLDANTSTEIRTEWTAYPSGLHEISTIIDPRDVIIELNETNNDLTNFTVVHGPDINVDLILNNMNPVTGDIINITGLIKNIGVLPANNFTVRIDIDNNCIKSVNISLLQNETLNISAEWTAIMGSHTIQVAADPDETIFETGEENNIASINVFVNAPDLNVTNIELNPVDPVDGDETWINTTITNQGFQEANNFSLDIFYEYSEFEGSLNPFESYSADGGNKWGERWVNLTWNNKTVDAGCIYIYIEEIHGSPVLRVFDRNNTLVTNSTLSRWIAVMGNAANISVYAGVHAGWNSMKLRFYAGNVTRFNNISLDINESESLCMAQEVSTGRHNFRVFADAGNSVNETNKENNIREKTVNVQPSREFFISNVSISANGYEIGVNNSIKDGDPVIVSAAVLNTGFREGIVDVDIIDEHDWVDASPRYEATSYGYARVISYPGADAIRVHFKELDVSPRDVVEIRDENGTLLCTISSNTRTSPWVEGDEIYLYKVRKPVAYGNYRYIACEIDSYQYRIVNRTTIEVAANRTAHIPARFTPGAGYHTIRVIADPDDKIGEINESNNEANNTLYVEPCHDPAAVDIMFDTQMPDPGDAVNLTATVTNHGNRTATFTVDLYAAKFEYRPFESPHPDSNSPIFSVFETDVTTYPEANRTGVHFTRISTDIDPKIHDDETYLQIYDKDGKLSEDYYGLYKNGDVWAWVADDLLKIKTELFCTGGGSCIWGYEIDTVAHTVTLNRTTVTLNPGETASITGTLPNVRIGYRSISYTITAVVDQENTVFETNEFNNRVSRELAANCPDLTVDFSPPDKAVIRNIGTGAAEDVEVRLWHDVNYTLYKEKYHRTEQRYMRFPPDEEKPGENPDAVRVHFEKLTFDEGEFRVKNGTEEIHTLSPGNYPDTWVEVEGKVSRIYCDYTDVEIDRYEYAYDTKVGDVPVGDIKKTTIPWTDYEAPYNLTIDADPGNDVLESNEDNNNKTIRIYAEIVPEWIYFSKPTEDKLAVDIESTIEVTIMNDGTAPTGEFNITLEVTDVNGTVVFNQSRHTSLSSMQSDKVEFEWIPSDEGHYTVSVIADSDGKVNELDEMNNIRSRDIYVYPFSGYSGGGSLINYKQDVFHGDVIFTIGDSTRQQSVSEDDTLRVAFDDAIPAKVKLARLYLYVDTGSDPGYNIALPIEVDMKFNGHGVQTDRKYTDISVASGWNVTYGLYCYDVTRYVDSQKENVAVATRISPKFGNFYYFGIAAIGLLVVTEDEDAVLTKYWINEGIDTVMAKNKNFDTGLPFEDCTVSAEFDDIEQEDLEAVNATLMAILSLVHDNKEDLYPEANGEGDVLRFNEHQIGSLMDGTHWIYQRPMGVGTIAMTDNKWEFVTDNLKRGNNLATFQSKGNYIVPSNAFLVLRYPPDLAVTDIDAPVSAVIGNKYVINTTISNDGKSNATAFNVSFYSDNVRVERQSISRLDSGDNITLHFNWQPMYMGKIYKLKVEADVVSGPDWVELDTENNEMTKNVPIVEGGYGNESGPMGEGGTGTGGSGDGGVKSLFDTITGILMKGSILNEGGGGGGGGIGEFSLLEWVMKGIVLTACFILVYFGYSMEKRRHYRR